jgi:hypothetical protein
MTSAAKVREIYELLQRHHAQPEAGAGSAMLVREDVWDTATTAKVFSGVRRIRLDVDECGQAVFLPACPPPGTVRCLASLFGLTAW